MGLLPSVGRRSLLRSLLAAPVVIAANRLMPVKSLVLPEPNLLSITPDSLIRSINGFGSGMINSIEMVLANGTRYAVARQIHLYPDAHVVFDMPMVLGKGDRLDVKTTGEAKVVITKHMLSSNQLVQEVFS